VSWSSTHRRREFGIRLALGARPADVRGLMLRETAPPLMIGVGAGLALDVAAGWLLRGLLYGVAPADPATLAAVCAVLAFSALLAADLPARRAAKTDPVEALRSE
jgi:putative ABC transport system permease protein